MTTGPIEEKKLREKTKTELIRIIFEMMQCRDSLQREVWQLREDKALLMEEGDYWKENYYGFR